MNLDSMRKACRLTAQTLDYIENFIKPGVSTQELNDICHRFILLHGGVPGCLGYKGFPKAICTSVNDVACHGIPSDKEILKDGDIIKIDVVVGLEGHYGDSCRTFAVGQISYHAYLLINLAYDAMMAGISSVQPGWAISEIGYRIDLMTKTKVVKDYCGHGIGQEMHTLPQVLHYYEPKYNPLLLPGMIITVEPIVNLGTNKTFVDKDGWTVRTKDGKLSAQFEHTVLVTETGYEILTISEKTGK